MPYANIECRRKYQRDAYQKKKLEYSEQRKKANENINNSLYYDLVNKRIQESKERAETINNKLYNEMMRKQQGRNEKNDIHGQEKEESEKYKITLTQDDETKELEAYLKNNWVKRQIKELEEMANSQYEKDGDINKLNERKSKMDYLKIQLKEMNDPPEVEPYIIKYEQNQTLDFLTLMSKYRTKKNMFHLVPISSEFIKQFLPEYWTNCVKHNFNPLQNFKKCII
jgi:hypothetical protein